MQTETVTAPKCETFSVNWFEQHIPVWEQLMELLPGRDKFLELGSFEGASACWMLRHMLSGSGSLYCIDTWEGSPEFINSIAKDVITGAFARFKENVAIAKQESQHVLTFRSNTVSGMAELISGGHAGTFDFVYVDAGHEAHHTLTDAVMAWPLLKTGGVLVFDDYLWSLNADLLNRPKIAIDAFTSIFNSQIKTLVVGHQYAIQKL
jgi:predicted O-methyltransferase YrrM